MVSCKLLKGNERVAHFQEVCVLVKRRKVVGNVLNHKVSHATTIQFGNVMMPIVAVGLQCEEQRFFGKAERTAVCQQETDARSSITIPVCVYELCYFFF